MHTPWCVPTWGELVIITGQARDHFSVRVVSLSNCISYPRTVVRDILRFGLNTALLAAIPALFFFVKHLSRARENTWITAVDGLFWPD
jgi:hypothetical protein